MQHPARLVRSIALSVLCSLAVSAHASDQVFESQLHSFKVVSVADGLETPWGMTFLPSGDMLVTEKGGTLRRVTQNGEVSAAIEGLPDIYASGQGGLLDVALHPQFESNGWVYLTYVGGGLLGSSTELARGKLVGNRLEGTEVLFVASDKSAGGRHFGSRIRFLGDGTLLLTLGDRGDRPRAQDLRDHAGSTIRLNDDGSVPGNNPFRNAANGALPELFTIGNRNVQGLTIHPETGEPWSHEHGPQGGDEVNVLRPGRNYGWPVITYGRNYGTGTRIGEGTRKAGMEQPVHYWDPSIAPSGMDFYTGSNFPEWKGDLFVGALKYRLLVRLRLDGERVVSEERLLADEYGRIRDVRNGPDGNLYLLTDDYDGQILRLEPAGN